MSVKIFGIDDDGKMDMIGVGRTYEQVSIFTYALDEQLAANYNRGMIVDNAERPEGLPMWIIYDHPRDWPSFFVAREFINMHRTGNFLLYREIEKLRDELEARGLVPMMRAPEDPSIILETWL